MLATLGRLLRRWSPWWGQSINQSINRATPLKKRAVRLWLESLETRTQPASLWPTIMAHLGTTTAPAFTAQLPGWTVDLQKNAAAVLTPVGWAEPTLPPVAPTSIGWVAPTLPDYMLLTPPPNVPIGNVEIQTEDTPKFPEVPGDQGLTGRGLPNAFHRLTSISFTLWFTVYLFWRMPAGAGPLNGPAGTDVIYTLATNTWQATFNADRIGNFGVGVNTINDIFSTITSGSFQLGQTTPIVLRGPSVNEAIRIRP